MAEKPESGDDHESSAYTGASVWPLLVAFGLVLSELGVLYGFRPVSVTGLLLFVIAIAGILTESGYIKQPVWATSIQGTILVIVGLVLTYQTDEIVRGQSIAIAGILSLVGASLWVMILKVKFDGTSGSSEIPSD